MIRKILHTLVILVFVSLGLNAQTVSLHDVQANPGEVIMPLDMTGFVGNATPNSITIKIKYDESVLEYVGFENLDPAFGSMTINYSGVEQRLILAWFDMNNQSPANGKLVDLKFKYKGGFSTNLEFTNVEVTHLLAPVSPIAEENGSVSPLANTNNITLGEVAAAVNANVSIPLSMVGADFDEVKAFTYEIQYCYEKLDFTGVTSGALNADELTVSHNSGNGNLGLNIQWSNLVAQDFSAADPLVYLNFVYVGGGDAPVKFKAGTEIADENNQLIPFTPNDGKVTLDNTATTASLSIQDVAGLVGETVSVPVDAADFGTNEIGAVNLVINYDASRLTYGSITSDQGVNFTVNASNGQIIIEASGSETDPIMIADGTFFTLNFNYVEEGTAAINFGAGSSFALVDLSPFPVNLNGGEVTQGQPLENIISGGDWNTAANWSLGVVPNVNHNVIVNEGSEVVIGALTQAIAGSVTINENAQLTNDGMLSIAGDLLITSTENGNGSFINNGTLNIVGDVTAQMYATTGGWHGISASLSGQVAHNLYLGGNPNVWIKDYDETVAAYNTTSPDFNTPLGDMKGWMMWVNGSVAQTFNFTGPLRSGVVETSETLTRSGANTNAGYGMNLVGNPFTSAIDWDAASGWVKQNIANSVMVYDPVANNFKSYVNGVGTNGGSQYIAMNQAFFVEVVSGQPTGTLKAGNAVQVHNNVPFYAPEVQNDMFKLVIMDGADTDEMAVVINENATENFDAQYDAGKMFSFDENHPQVFAVASDERMLSINAIPSQNNINVDVKGADGHMLIIKSIDADEFEYITLVDKATNSVVDIKNNYYEFEYDADITDRFEIKFGPISNQPNLEVTLANIYSQDQSIMINSLSNKSFTAEVYNLLGQVVATEKASDNAEIYVPQKGTYLVRVTEGTQTQVKKVVIK